MQIVHHIYIQFVYIWLVNSNGYIIAFLILNNLVFILISYIVFSKKITFSILLSINYGILLFFFMFYLSFLLKLIIEMNIIMISWDVLANSFMGRKYLQTQIALSNKSSKKISIQNKSKYYFLIIKLMEWMNI